MSIRLLVRITSAVFPSLTNNEGVVWCRLTGNLFDSLYTHIHTHATHTDKHLGNYNTSHINKLWRHAMFFRLFSNSAAFGFWCDALHTHDPYTHTRPIQTHINTLRRRCTLRFVCECCITFIEKQHHTYDNTSYNRVSVHAHMHTNCLCLCLEKQIQVIQ